MSARRSGMRVGLDDNDQLPHGFLGPVARWPQAKGARGIRPAGWAAASAAVDLVGSVTSATTPATARRPAVTPRRSARRGNFAYYLVATSDVTVTRF
jgi:hypothetical protein